MKERPILMKGPLVVATLEDRKTQTRRICKAACERGIWADGAHPARDGMPIFWWNIAGRALADRAAFTQQVYATGTPCPHGAIGDRLWVRETWAENTVLPLSDRPNGSVIYRADGKYSTRWRPSIHMPHWASRLTLEITGVRVERLQDISQAEICAELGAPLTWYGNGTEPYRRDLYGAFASLWDTTTTNPAHRWAANPFVWVLSYKRITPADRVP